MCFQGACPSTEEIGRLDDDETKTTKQIQNKEKDAKTGENTKQKIPQRRNILKVGDY